MGNIYQSFRLSIRYYPIILFVFLNFGISYKFLKLDDSSYLVHVLQFLLVFIFSILALIVPVWIIFRVQNSSIGLKAILTADVFYNRKLPVATRKFIIRYFALWGLITAIQSYLFTVEILNPFLIGSLIYSFVWFAISFRLRS